MLVRMDSEGLWHFWLGVGGWWRSHPFADFSGRVGEVLGRYKWDDIVLGVDGSVREEEGGRVSCGYLEVEWKLSLEAQKNWKGLLKYSQRKNLESN